VSAIFKFKLKETFNILPTLKRLESFKINKLVLEDNDMNNKINAYSGFIVF